MLKSSMVVLTKINSFHLLIGILDLYVDFNFSSSHLLILKIMFDDGDGNYSM